MREIKNSFKILDFTSSLEIWQRAFGTKFELIHTNIYSLFSKQKNYNFKMLQKKWGSFHTKCSRYFYEDIMRGTK